MWNMPTLLTAGVATLAVAAAAMVNATTPDSEGVVVMSADEAQLHQERMRAMTIEERDAYRDQQYQLLREKMIERGLTLPEVPPWKEGSAASETTAAQQSGEAGGQVDAEPVVQNAAPAGESAPVAEAPVAMADQPVGESASTVSVETAPQSTIEFRQQEAEARRAEMEQQAEARRAENEQKAAARRAEMEQKAEARRAEMAQQAEERRAAMALPTGEPPAPPADLAAQHEVRQQQAEARRAEMEQQAEARRAEMAQQAEERRAAMVSPTSEPPAPPADLAAQHEVRQQQAEARRAEMEQQAEARRAEMAQQAEERRAAMVPSMDEPPAAPVDLAAQHEARQLAAEARRAEMGQQAESRRAEMQERRNARLRAPWPYEAGRYDRGYGGFGTGRAQDRGARHAEMIEQMARQREQVQQRMDAAIDSLPAAPLGRSEAPQPPSRPYGYGSGWGYGYPGSPYAPRAGDYGYGYPAPWGR